MLNERQRAAVKGGFFAMVSREDQNAFCVAGTMLMKGTVEPSGHPAQPHGIVDLLDNLINIKPSVFLYLAPDPKEKLAVNVTREFAKTARDNGAIVQAYKRDDLYDSFIQYKTGAGSKLQEIFNECERRGFRCATIYEAAAVAMVLTYKEGKPKP